MSVGNFFQKKYAFLEQFIRLKYWYQESVECQLLGGLKEYFTLSVISYLILNTTVSELHS